MRTAEEILHEQTDWLGDYLSRDAAIEAINEARKEAIEECAKRSSLLFHCGTTKENKSIPYFQSGADNIQPNRLLILSLIKELK